MPTECWQTPPRTSLLWGPEVLPLGPERGPWVSVPERRMPRGAAAWATAALVALVSLVARPAGLAAQTLASDPHAAQPERPTVATHAGTVATGWFEIEAGTELDRYADRSRGEVAPVSVKLGLAPCLQLSL